MTLMQEDLLAILDSQNMDKQLIQSKRDSETSELMPEPTSTRHQRLPRTKLAWRGKACWVSMPPRSHDTVTPLRTSEVHARLRRWEQAGFSTSGFDHAVVDTQESLHPQTRLELDDVVNDMDSVQERDIKVRVPDPKEWAAYVTWLTEEKLRALGVSTGLDEPVSTQSRHSSAGFLRRSVTPRINLSFANSLPLGRSPRPTPTLSHFGTTPYSRAMSVISPLTAPFDTHNVHVQRQAGFSPSYGLQQDLYAEIAFPVSPGNLRAASSSLESPGLDTISGISPAISPPWYASQPQNLLHQSTARFSSKNTLGAGELQMQSVVGRPEEGEAHMHDYFGQAYATLQTPPEIIVPTPRHKHNISQSLERDILRAEYHFDEATSNNGYETESPFAATEQILAAYENLTPSVHLPNPTQAVPRATRPAGPARQSSTLSVTAPEFKFNPGRSSVVNEYTSHAVTPTFTPITFGDTSIPCSGFDFASAATFMPGATAFEPLPISASDSRSGEQPIFAEVEISSSPDVVKPKRRSMAIAIVQPPRTPAKEREEMYAEDEYGRITQSSERQKRPFSAQPDGDSVPLFAECPELLIEPMGNLHLSAHYEASAVDHPEGPLVSAVDCLDAENENKDFNEPAAIETTLEESARSTKIGESIEGDAVETFAEPSIGELDAVMRQFVLTEAECETEAERRSNAPSPAGNPRHPHSASAEQQQSRPTSPINDPFSDGQAEMSPSPAQNLGDILSDTASDSDWSDVSSTKESSEPNTRSTFLEDRIDSLVGSVVHAQLIPLEKTLQEVQRSVSALSRRDSEMQTQKSIEIDSDADDEDDTVDSKPLCRTTSPVKDRKLELIKAAVMEAMDSQQASAPQLSQASEIHAVLVDMSTMIAQLASARPHADDIRAVVDETLQKQSKALNPATPVRMRHQRQVTELEGRLNETLAGAIEEANQRHMVEQREADMREQLDLAQDELTLMRAAVAEKDQRIHALRDDCHGLKERVASAEKTKRKLEKDLSSVEEERTALQATFDEYRTSSTKWRQEIDETDLDREVLRATVQELEAQLADGLEVRENMRGKLDQIQGNMATAAAQLANEKTMWHSRNEELQKNHAVLQARLEMSNEVHSAAVDTLRQRHSEDLHVLRMQHERAIFIAVEDKQRAEVFATERLGLSQAKSDHLLDRISLLEEKLEIAKSAAQAAVSAAQAAKATSFSTKDEPERISPQALRETILVLQDQLQERERHVERLQAEIAGHDTVAPAKLKERDIEITWLRELLAVRNDDLSELIDSLSTAAFDRDHLRDTAIRMKATLQMEQQEKERLISAGSSLTGQALAGLTNFASPKAVQLAAAIGSWRKGRDSGISLSSPQLSQLRDTTSTPSKMSPNSAASFLSGLMGPTPSSSPLTPRMAAASVQRQNSQSRSSRSSLSKLQQKTRFALAQEQEASIPLSFRSQSYDDDAELGAPGEGLGIDIDDGVDADDVGADATARPFRSLESELELLQDA